jgi:hypothetical protein
MELPDKGDAVCWSLRYEELGGGIGGGWGGLGDRSVILAGDVCG